MRKHPPVTLRQLCSTPHAPRFDSWHVGLDEPAQTVMTDFTQRNMVTVDGALPVDAALEIMRHAGVRSAFVLDAGRERVLGLITAYDIMGEKPMRHLQSIGCTHLTCTRDDVKVADIMQRAEEWFVASLEDVQGATVGSMLDALQKSGGTHLPVMETPPGREPFLRGVFSYAKLKRLTEESRRDSAAPAQAAGARGA